MKQLYAIVLVCLQLIVLASSAFLPTEQITPAADPENYRLPTTVVPTNYDLTIRPYLLATDNARRFTFDGEVTIGIHANQETNLLVLHSRNLTYEIKEYWLATTPNTKLTLPEPLINNVTDIYTFNLAQPLNANTDYVLHFKYTGSMGDDMHGFYRSNYTDANGNEKWIGSTQFQPVHARRAFPAFDEPKFKATFDVKLIHPRTMKSWSNTRSIASTESGDLITSVYERTPIMSTYLLAFIISEFTERNNTKFGVIARPEYYNQTEYSFDVGPPMLEYLSSYLDIDYYSMGVDKMHMAAIPDFSAGAMENWGLLTYRERALLYDPDSTILSTQQYIAAVVAHEQTHMWFGDFVTCDWWSYTWLNEGFARYFQYFGTAAVEKQYMIDQQFVVDQIQSVMNMDSTNNTNPLSDENTNSPADISRMFNSISYNKGAAFIRMVRHAMNETNFQTAIREYLKENGNKTTVPQNIFDKWSKYWPSGHADGLFKSFTEQVGYPVVNVTLAANGNSFTVSQKRFLLKSGDGANASLLYTIPFSYTTDKDSDFADTTPSFFIEANTAVTNHTLSQSSSWIIANIQETGYYRVNYDTNTWHRIHRSLNQDKWSNIHELNRAQIVDDLFNLARSGEIQYSLALDVLEYLTTETHYLPWTSAFNGFNYLAIRLGTDSKNFGRYILELTEKSYKQLGFDEKSTDTALEIYNRAKILAWSCKYGNNQCVQKSKDLFKTFAEKPVAKNIRSVVYCVAMREGSNTDFDSLFHKYQNEPVATEQQLILGALGCVKNTALIEKYFAIIVSNEVRLQDKSAALSALYSENSENVWPVYKLVTKNVDDLANSMGGTGAVATVISNIASRFTEKYQVDDLEQFTKDNEIKFGGSVSTLNVAITTAQDNLKWSEEKLSVFRSFLDDRFKNGATTINVFTLTSILLFSMIAMFIR